MSGVSLVDVDVAEDVCFFFRASCAFSAVWAYIKPKGRVGAGRFLKKILISLAVMAGAWGSLGRGNGGDDGQQVGVLHVNCCFFHTILFPPQKNGGLVTIPGNPLRLHCVAISSTRRDF